MSIIKVNQIQDTSTNVAANISGGVVTFNNRIIQPQDNKGLFQVYLGANQNIASSSTDLVGLNTKVFDVDNYFNTSTYRYTPQVAGYYYIECKIGWRPKAADDNVNLSAYLFKNGNHWHSTGAAPYLSGNTTARPIGQMCMKVGAGKEVDVAVASLVYFNVSSDYVDLRANIYNYTNSSATDNHVIGNANQMLTYMSGYRIT